MRHMTRRWRALGVMAAMGAVLAGSPVAQASFIEDFNNGLDNWEAPLVHDGGGMTYPAATYHATGGNGGGFISADVDNSSDRLYGFQPGDASPWGDLTGQTLTADFQILDGAVNGPSGPRVRFYVGSTAGGSNYFVSNDAFSWNPNADRSWTTHQVALLPVNFVAWPDAAAQSMTFEQVVASANDIGLVFANDTAHFDNNQYVGFSSHPGAVLALDNFGTLGGSDPLNPNQGGGGSSIPEPASLALLLAGTALIAGRGHRHDRT